MFWGVVYLLCRYISSIVVFESQYLHSYTCQCFEEFLFNHLNILIFQHTVETWMFSLMCSSFWVKGVELHNFQPRITFLSSFTHTHVVPNHWLSSMEHKRWFLSLYNKSKRKRCVLICTSKIKAIEKIHYFIC